MCEREIGEEGAKCANKRKKRDEIFAKNRGRRSKEHGSVRRNDDAFDHPLSLFDFVNIQSLMQPTSNF